MRREGRSSEMRGECDGLGLCCGGRLVCKGRRGRNASRTVHFRSNTNKFLFAKFCLGVDPQCLVPPWRKY
jgi:hypothetical protein